MIQSMTAFARQQVQGDWGTLVWEIRSVNQRYLEISLRLPDGFRELEALLRAAIRQSIQRGKIECTLRYAPGPSVQADVKINAGLVRALIQAGQEIDQICHTRADFRTMDFLRWDGVVDVSTGDLSQLHDRAQSAFADALQQLKAARLREGAAMQEVIADRLNKMTALIATVQTLYPEAVAAFRERIQTRLQEFAQQLNPERLEQEVALLAYKSDIAEELDRLSTHCKEVLRILQKDDAAGRRLDFLMQELNREANTLSSKSIHVGITTAAVEIKVLIEQMREQVQNIE